MFSAVNVNIICPSCRSWKVQRVNEATFGVSVFMKGKKMKYPFTSLSDRLFEIKSAVKYVGVKSFIGVIKEDFKEKGEKVLKKTYESLEEYNESQFEKADDFIDNGDFSNEQLEELALNHSNNFVREAAKKALNFREE